MQNVLPITTVQVFLHEGGASSTLFCFPPRDRRLQNIFFLHSWNVLLDQQPEGDLLIFYFNRSQRIRGVKRIIDTQYKQKFCLHKTCTVDKGFVTWPFYICYCDCDCAPNTFL